jgi:tRNA-dihydrouridine synthase
VGGQVKKVREKAAEKCAELLYVTEMIRCIQLQQPKKNRFSLVRHAVSASRGQNKDVRGQYDENHEGYNSPQAV